MSSVMRSTIAVAAVAALSILTGCSEPPQAEIDAVKASVQSAEAADAATYAPAELEAAREAERAAVAEVEAQKAKFVLSRSYEQATGMLADAAAKADDARVAAVTNREEAMAAANDAVEALTGQLTAVEADLAALGSCRRAPKGFAQDLELMRGKVEALSAQVAELEAQVAAERFLEARDLAATIEPEMTAVATDLAGAREKLGC
ncbi:MAG TPA: hypothetical protein VLB51_04155 [Methylomirabilota bacterium]|jgi:golgin subfamily B member 1|nr:hypothetical protein [Methylomirabilota bacterium]